MRQFRRTLYPSMPAGLLGRRNPLVSEAAIKSTLEGRTSNTIEEEDFALKVAESTSYLFPSKVRS